MHNLKSRVAGISVAATSAILPATAQAHQDASIHFHTKEEVTAFVVVCVIAAAAFGLHMVMRHRRKRTDS